MASGYYSAVSGGRNNEAAAGIDNGVDPSSISGGCNQIADEECQHLPACEDGCAADTNADAVIDVQDLTNVILAWGVCP